MKTHRSRRAQCESLESRLFLSGDQPIRIDFLPAKSKAPADFLADIGDSYADRGNGFTYGWNTDNQQNARKRGVESYQQYDTFNHMQKPGGASVWGIALPNGKYTVRIIAGDAGSNYDAQYGIDVEGVTVVAGAPKPGKRFFEGAKAVDVNDGILTLTNSADAINNKIAFMEIAPASAAVETSLTIEVENFDDGGEGVSYHDLDASNHGNDYRNTAVELSPITSGSDNYILGWAYAGEWLQYTVDIAASGTYDLSARVSSVGQGGKFHVNVDGVNKTGTMIIPDTATWSNYTTITKSGVQLTAGQHVLRLAMDANGKSTSVGNFDWLKLDPTASSSASINWTTGKAAPIARVEPNAIQVGGKLYITGGFINFNLDVTNRLDIFDLATQTWSTGAANPGAQTHSGMATDGRYFYMAAGQKGGGIPGTATSEVWRYDTTANTWFKMKSLPAARYGGSLVYLAGKLHYYGGDLPDRTTITGDHWELDLANPTKWIRRASLSPTGDHMSAAVINGKIYAIGGEHDHAAQENDHAQYIQHANLVEYDPATDKWTRKADLPFGSSHAEAMTLVINNKIVMMGGQIANSDATDITRIYDPATDKWTIINSIPAIRKGAASAYYNGKIYLTNGQAGTPTYTISKNTWVGTVLGI